MHPSTAELVARARRLPAVLAEALATPLPPGVDALRGRRLVLGGIGASEAVAHFAAAHLAHERGLPVVVRPASSFLDAPAQAGEALVVLSQALSPNARLALARTGDFDRALLVTAVPAGDARLDDFRAAGGLAWTLPPREEQGLLVRVMGPLAQAAALWRLGACLAGAPESGLPGDLVARVERALDRGFEAAARWPANHRRTAFLACGWYARALDLLSWSWMEAWFVEPPPAWDVLQFAHGPWQALHGTPMPLLLLRRPGDPELPWARLDAVVRSPGAAPREVVALPSTLPGGAAFFEHAAAVTGLLAGTLERSPVDLAAWPGRGTDGPLYELGPSGTHPARGAATAPAARSPGAAPTPAPAGPAPASHRRPGP